jgi:hypothetical protein
LKENRRPSRSLHNGRVREALTRGGRRDESPTSTGFWTFSFAGFPRCDEISGFRRFSRKISDRRTHPLVAARFPEGRGRGRGRKHRGSVPKTSPKFKGQTRTSSSSNTRCPGSSLRACDSVPRSIPTTTKTARATAADTERLAPSRASAPGVRHSLLHAVALAPPRRPR